MSNQENSKVILRFHDFMIENGSSERHQNNNLKIMFIYAQFLESRLLIDIDSQEEVISFLRTKVKTKEVDFEQKWITTYNDYLHRIKHFFRWLHNHGENTEETVPMDSWKTPDFLNSLAAKRTKRLSPYYENEIWDKDELLSIIKYEPTKRNKAILALLWDLDARPHEITALKIKNIRFKEKFAEGEIPYHTKTGAGPVMLTLSFPYVRDWLNEHPFKNSPDSSLICNLNNGAPIKPDAINTMMKQLRERISRLLETDNIQDKDEKERLLLILNNKKFNPYCIRHSAITYDSDYLPDYALKKKVRWSMNSRQSARYIKTRMGNELKNKILEYNGIFSDEMQKKIPSISTCPRCEFSNAIDTKYCDKCSYPLTVTAYEEYKNEDESRFKELEEKYKQEIATLKMEIEAKTEKSIQTMFQQKYVDIQRSIENIVKKAVIESGVN